MSWRLFVDSSTFVEFEVEWDADIRHEKLSWVSRGKTGLMLMRRNGSTQNLRLSVWHVNSSTRAIVDSWWQSGTDLNLIEVGGTVVTSCYITGNRTPINRLQFPYPDQFSGVIELEGEFDALGDLPRY